MLQVHFLIPDPSAFISGGNVYNAHLIHALIDQGAHVSHGIFRPDIMLSSPDTLYILDSICFGQIDEPDHQIPGRCLGLIHHLNSLYPMSEDYFQHREKAILDHFSGFIVTSNFTLQYLAARGFDPSRICVIEPAPTIQSRVRKPPSQLVNAFMLGSVIPRKGQLAFLQSLAEADLPSSYTIVIAGSLTADRDYAQQCIEVIQNNDSLKTCVKILAEQKGTTVQQLYANSNLYLSSAEMETFGMAIQDAVVSGIPVLAIEGGYAAEHVSHGINGYRCKTHEQLAAELGHCINDSDHFLAMQDRALAFEHQYHTWTEGATTLIDLYSG
jgi:glycosyltransferase involved in cell wall biosynthesis